MSTFGIVAAFCVVVAGVLAGGGAAYIEFGLGCRPRRGSAIVTGVLAFMVGNQFFNLGRLLLTIAARTQP